MIYVVSGWPGGAPHVAFVGDTIFAGSLAKGFVSAAQLRENTREQILTLPPETLLCPGHGPVTTVARWVARLTEADRTPWSLDSFRSTRVEHAAHVIPCTRSV